MARTRFTHERHALLIEEIYGSHAPGSASRWRDGRELRRSLDRRRAAEAVQLQAYQPPASRYASPHATPYGAGRPKMDPRRMTALCLELADGRRSSRELAARYGVSSARVRQVRREQAARIESVRRVIEAARALRLAA